LEFLPANMCVTEPSPPACKLRIVVRQSHLNWRNSPTRTANLVSCCLFFGNKSADFFVLSFF
jgi:hypothetical protein